MNRNYPFHNQAPTPAWEKPSPIARRPRSTFRDRLDTFLWLLPVVAMIAGLALLSGCGGGGSEDDYRVDDGSLSYKMWLWEKEGGDPAKFTLKKFCKAQPEHC